MTKKPEDELSEDPEVRWQKYDDAVSALDKQPERKEMTKKPEDELNEETVELQIKVPAILFAFLTRIAGRARVSVPALVAEILQENQRDLLNYANELRLEQGRATEGN